jgi:RNA polymerase primary sigma factor
VLQELLIRADQRGYVTFEDVLEVLDEDGDDVNAIETILYELDELGIELRQESEPPDSFLLAEEGETDFEPEEILQDPTVGDISAVSADDPVGLYFRQMAQEPLLTAQEEIELAKRIELGKQARETYVRLGTRDMYSETWVTHLERLSGDGQAAREHLGRANTRLVVSIAKRYMGQGLPFPDLIQEGNVGLMRAVDKYDYKRGNRFSTYATWWIRQAITRALAQKTRTIRIPLHMTERIRQMYRTAQNLEQTLGRRPSPEEIANKFGLSRERIRQLEKEALRRLRHPRLAHNLRDYLG